MFWSLDRGQPPSAPLPAAPPPQDDGQLGFGTGRPGF